MIVRPDLMNPSHLQQDPLDDEATPAEAAVVTNTRESFSLADKLAANEDSKERAFHDTPILVCLLSWSHSFH